MHKYVALYKDGTAIPFWAIDRNMAAFRAKDGERLHGTVVKVVTAKQYLKTQKKKTAGNAA